jgi:hypothetical protein
LIKTIKKTETNSLSGLPSFKGQWEEVVFTARESAELVVVEQEFKALYSGVTGLAARNYKKQKNKKTWKN